MGKKYEPKSISENVSVTFLAKIFNIESLS